jgi:hypothetical protein
MKKIVRSKARLVKCAAIALGVVVVAFALKMAMGSIAEKDATQRAQLEATISSKNVELANVLAQAGKASDAKREFAEISLTKENKDFTVSTSSMKKVLKELQQETRLLPGLKLTLSPETVDARPEFTVLPKQVLVRESMQLQFSAMSDAHVFTFMKTLQERAPGLIQFTSLKLQRTGDVTAATLSQMSSGGTPALVMAILKFRWVGIAEKPEPTGTP